MQMINLTYRRATEADLGKIVELLADDILGASREVISPEVGADYRSAFAYIKADQNQYLCLVED